MIDRFREILASWTPRSAAAPLAFCLGVLCGFGLWIWGLFTVGIWISQRLRLLAWAGAVTALAAAAAMANPPNTAAGLVLTDLRSLPAGQRLTTRYVSDINAERMVALNYILNSVSHSRMISHATPIGEGIARIDLSAFANYRDPHSLKTLLTAWESLVEFDPYFHLRTQVLVKGEKTPKTLTIDGGWIDIPVSQELRALSGSAGAVLRSDYFIAKVAAPPAYYAWANVPATEGELLKSVGVDRDEQNRLASNTAANVLVSAITHKPRRILHFNGPLGSVWVTQDVNSEAADKDPTRAPINYDGPKGLQAFKFDASEIFFRRPNRFWGTALFDAKGKIQAEVPPNIAHDPHLQDGRVLPMASCINCHEHHGGSGGLQGFKDDQFALLTGEASVLTSYLPEVAARVAELYDPSRMNLAVERDRLDYADAVQRATRNTPGVATTAVIRVYRTFTEDPVSRAIAAKECGVTDERFMAMTLTSRDPIVLSLRAGKQVRRGNFESAYQETLLLRGK